MALDSVNNVYVVGQTDSALDGESSAGADDAFITKYTSTGEKQWTRQFGTTFDDRARGVAVDDADGVYVAGYTAGSLDGNASAGGNDLFLVKYDGEGSKIWTRQLGSAGSELTGGVVVGVDGGIYVIGSTNAGLDGNTHLGGMDVFVVRYTPGGDKAWSLQFGTGVADHGTGVASGADGSLLINGYTGGALDGVSAGSYDAFIAKYDVNGAPVWVRQLGTSEVDYALASAVDSSGNVYVSGQTKGGLDGNISAGTDDMFVAKFDAEGEKTWTRQLGSGEQEHGDGITLDTSGAVYVVGGTSGALDGNAKKGAFDIFVTKYEPDGTKLWTNQFGTVGGEIARGATSDLGDNLYIAGETRLGLDDNLHAGKDDMYVKRLCAD